MKPNSKILKNELSKPIPQGNSGEENEGNIRNEEVAIELQRRIREAQKDARVGEGKGDTRQIDNKVAFEYAKETNTWIDDLYSLGDFFVGGNENSLAHNEKEVVVYKSNNLSNVISLSSFFDKIKLHNSLFPETKYTFVGFSGISDANGMKPYVEPVYKQDFIKDAEFATISEIDEYMIGLGFEKIADYKYKKDNIEVWDLRPRNVLKDTNGDIYVIDAEFKELVEQKENKEIMSKIKGITEIQYEDDGKTIIYGSKNNKTRISVKNMTEEDIKEEFNFEKKMLENQKTDLPNKIKNNEYVQKSMSSSLKEKDDSRKLLDSAKKNIEILESIVVPFYEEKLKEFKVEAVAEQKENKEMAQKGNVTNTELDKAVSDLHRAETLQETMKKANAIIRSKKNVTERLIKEAGMSESSAIKAQQPDYAGRVGFATYQLTNNNASIKRLQERVKMLEKKVEGAKAAEAGAEEKYTFDGGVIKVNYEEDRVQILLDSVRADKPMYQMFRKNGYVFSPTNKAFQRKITPQAIRNAVQLMKATKVEGELKKGIEVSNGDTETLSFFKSLIGKKIKLGTGEYARIGKVIDVEEKNGGKISNTGVFLYFLEQNTDVTEEIKVNEYDIDKYKKAEVKISSEEIFEPNTGDEFDEVILANIDPKDSWKGNLMKERDVKSQIYSQLSGAEDEKEKEVERLFELYASKFEGDVHKQHALEYPSTLVDLTETEDSVNFLDELHPLDMWKRFDGDGRWYRKFEFPVNDSRIREITDMGIKERMTTRKDGGYDAIISVDSMSWGDEISKTYVKLFPIECMITDKLTESETKKNEYDFNNIIKREDVSIKEVFQGENLKTIKFEWNGGFYKWAYSFSKTAGSLKVWKFPTEKDLMSNMFTTGVKEEIIYNTFNTEQTTDEGSFIEFSVSKWNLKEFFKESELDKIPVVAKEEPITDFKGINYSYKNQYELNKAIEALLIQRAGTTLYNDSSEYTSDEKNFIRKYSGYGGLDKYGTTGKGGLFEYYTPKEIIERMWALAYKYGYNNGSVLEPSIGIGEFLQYAPKDAHVVGYEINEFSAKICKILYPTAEVNVQPFEKTFIGKNNWTMKDNLGSLEKFDLVIGNPPYGDFSIVESRYMSGMGEKDHTKARNYVEYFIRRGLDLLKSGGLLIYIVGAQLKNGGNMFLDSGETPVKDYLAANCELLDAYRLPDSVFERTGVTSDIIVLKKL